MLYLPLDTSDTGRSGYQQWVKESNIKRIFDLVRSGKCSSRAELVRCMNLSATSVSVLVEELAKRRLIDEIGPAQTSLPGRRPISLRLNSDAHQMVVFTPRNNSVRYTLLDLSCRILESLTCPLDPVPKTPEQIAVAYGDLMEDILAHRAKVYDHRRVIMVGVNFPGFYDERNHLFHSLQDLNVILQESIIREFHARVRLPVLVFNSTHSLAWAEKKALDTAGPDTPETLDMLYMTIEDIVSCSIIANGNLYDGPFNVSGRIGHFTIDFDGRPCPCGNIGCLERYVSADAILGDAREAARASGLEEPQTFEALAGRYAAEPVLKASVLRSAQLLAIGLYNALCSSGMNKVVLGGSIAILGDLFLNEVYRALCRRTLLIHHLDLSYAQAGPDAQSVGIAHYFLDKIFTVTT